MRGEKDAVAAALLALEGVVPHRAGAGAADVVALCRGAEDVFVTGVVGAPAEVYVLEVGKKVFIEDADLVEDALAVKCRTAAGRECGQRGGVNQQNNAKSRRSAVRWTSSCSRPFCCAQSLESSSRRESAMGLTRMEQELNSSNTRSLA